MEKDETFHNSWKSMKTLHDEFKLAVKHSNWFRVSFVHHLILGGVDSVRNGQDCNSPCASIDTYFGIPDTQKHRNGSHHLQLYFKNMVAVQRSHTSYPIESLIAEIGGYLGLLLGVSIMDLYNVFGKIGSMFSKVFSWNILFGPG